MFMYAECVTAYDIFNWNTLDSSGPNSEDGHAIKQRNTTQQPCKVRSLQTRGASWHHVILPVWTQSVVSSTSTQSNHGHRIHPWDYVRFWIQKALSNPMVNPNLRIRKSSVVLGTYIAVNHPMTPVDSWALAPFLSAAVPIVIRPVSKAPNKIPETHRNSPLKLLRSAKSQGLSSPVRCKAGSNIFLRSGKQHMRGCGYKIGIPQPPQNPCI